MCIATRSSRCSPISIRDIELYWTMSIGVNREIVDDALEVKFGAR